MNQLTIDKEKVNSILKVHDQFCLLNVKAGLYIVEFPSPGGGERNPRVWRLGRKSKGKNREKSKIGGKSDFWQYLIIKLVSKTQFKTI